GRRRRRGHRAPKERRQLRNVLDRPPVVEALPPAERVGLHGTGADLLRALLALHGPDRDVVDRDVPLVERGGLAAGGRSRAARGVLAEVRPEGGAGRLPRGGQGADVRSAALGGRLRPAAPLLLRLRSQLVTADDDRMAAAPAVHLQRAAHDLLVGDLVLRFAVGTEELHEWGAVGWGSLEQAHQVVFDPPPRVLVGRVGQRALPHLDGFVLETGTLIQDGEV